MGHKSELHLEIDIFREIKVTPTYNFQSAGQFMCSFLLNLLTSSVFFFLYIAKNEELCKNQFLMQRSQTLLVLRRKVKIRE